MDLVNILKKIRTTHSLLKNMINKEDRLYLKINEVRVVALEEFDES